MKELCMDASCRNRGEYSFIRTFKGGMARIQAHLCKNCAERYKKIFPNAKIKKASFEKHVEFVKKAGG